MTIARIQMLEILQKIALPLSASDILSKMDVNKTTVYRELDFLRRNGLVDEVDLADGIRRFEIKKDNHHHHLVCMNCKRTSDVEVEEHFKIPEGFKLVKHNLEFFGFCSNCQ